jgi:ATP-dependent exoDNAse (exonuclease V) beta subunit
MSELVQMMTMTVSKGLKCPVVALHGVGQMPDKGEDEQEPDDGGQVCRAEEGQCF